jgi:integrase
LICKKCKKEIENDSIFCRFCGKRLNEAPRPKTLKRANGTGCVYKLSGTRRKPWAVISTISGKRTVMGTFESKTEANKYLEIINENKSISSIYDNTVEDMYNMLIDLNKDKLTKSGLTNYRSGFIYLEPFKSIKMREIRTVHIQDAINKAAEEGKGFATWKKIQNVASLICQLAMANDLIDKNYAQLVTMPGAKKKAEKPSFSPAQLDKMWALWQIEDTVLAVLAMCYIGLRINEFLDLKKKHVDLSERVIFATGSKTEAGKNRILIIPPVALPLFERMMETDGEYLFPSPSGKRYDAKNFRDRAFYPTLETYNLDKWEIDPSVKITPHSCRHTYAYLCVKNGLDPKATMDLMGHSKYSTSTELYAEATKHDIEFLRKEADKISKH